MSNLRIPFISFLMVLSLVVGVYSPPAANSKVPDPSEQLKPFIDKIVAILTDPELQGDEACAQRRQRVMAAANERFDFFEMSKRVLGTQWRKLSSADQKQFVGLFKTLLEHAYIGKIEDYSKQKVVFKDQLVRNDRAQVETDLIDKDVVIPVSYIMILKNNEWMVYDIVVEGVSLVRNYMEQFKEIIRKDGYPSLLKQMQDKIKELETSISKPCPVDVDVKDQ